MLERNTHNSSAKRGTKVVKAEPDKKARYNLSLPEEVLSEVKRVAEKEDVSILHVIRQFLKLGLTYYRMKEIDPDTKLIIRHGNTEQVVLWF